MAHVEDLVEGPTEFDRVWDLHPRYYELFTEGYFAAAQRVDPVIFELCRLRMAQVLGSELDLTLRYRPAIEAGLTEERIAALPMYPTNALFSERERACVNFAEQYAIQSTSITDEDAAALQKIITPMEFVLLTKALSPIDQFQRICVALDIRPSSEVPSRLSGFVRVADAAATR